MPDLKEISDFVQIGIVTRYELLKHLRRRRLLAVLAITFIICALQLGIRLALGIPFPDIKQFASSFLSFINFLIVICGAFFAGDAVASEFQNKTGYIIFPNPIRRITLLIGKFFAALLSVLMVVVTYYAIGILSMLGIYGVVPLEIGVSLAYSILYTCSVLGLTFLFSTVFKGTTGATLLSFFTLLLILPILSSIGSFTGTEPWFELTYASGIITEAIAPPSQRIRELPPNSPSNPSPITLWQFHPDFLTSVVVLALYFAATLMLSLFIVKRKEMT